MHGKPEDGNDRTLNEIRIVNTNYVAVIVDSEENLTSGSIKESIEAFFGRIGPCLLEINGWAFSGRNLKSIIHISIMYQIFHKYQYYQIWRPQ